ncbi:hypothetical protein HY640_01215 [Candidatus Woesearchaeota archaeon]|nr:hypothetical protein [Candidatus Woesearchaeota archaeon]
MIKGDRVWYPSMLAKEIDCSYPHMMSVLAEFEAAGLIKSEGMGRIRVLHLTEQGDDLARDFELILRRIDRIERGEPKRSEKEKGKEKEE